jgi:hypothetical protein
LRLGESFAAYADYKRNLDKATDMLARVPEPPPGFGKFYSSAKLVNLDLQIAGDTLRALPRATGEIREKLLAGLADFAKRDRRSLDEIEAAMK